MDGGEEAKRRRIEPLLLAPGDDLCELARGAVDRGADVIGMAGATLVAAYVNHLRRANVRELADLRAAADAAAVRDHLTGVANRRGLAMVGSQMVEQARRAGDAVH